MKRLLIIVMCVGVISCDFYYNYEYIVQKDSSSEIIVDLYVEQGTGLDTIYTIESKQSLQICET